MNKRSFIAALPAVLAAAAAFAATPAQAAAPFPDKPITLVIPYPPGGPTDAMARTLANEMSTHLPQPMIVENRAGANGNIGAEYVARAAPDGYTLMFGTSGPLAINASLYQGLGYDPVKSFAPIIHVGYLPNVLVVNPAIPAKTVPELVAWSKTHPRALSFASSGSGASSHLAGVMFNSVAGTDFLHVPYKGTGPALNDLLGGHVAMSFTDVLTAKPFVENGKLRALGVTTLKPSRALPGVPTIAEQGYPGYDVSVFFGVVAPAGTPADRIEALNRAFVQALRSEKVKALFASQGLESAPDSSPRALGAFIAQEKAKWADVVKRSGAQIN
ncbi:Bug family tripartite tricarboxylate transporter substrate binding protein [Achromobacter aloeverae]|uniref:ABC transporter substrate-binding protein n=1 Tax=Achromobacter aloeverae TaxID=1750518 RepID=A0A4Q1HFG5_9BURK|nr:tripartite tricarboxylate transporter substrate binding protein [Achromobacter aloeverae]RXN85298.1 ABC transporter substrate-binding protein [Achromobacter aloeverae]